jgi:hypothetical protein
MVIIDTILGNIQLDGNNFAFSSKFHKRIHKVIFYDNHIYILGGRYGNPDQDKNYKLNDTVFKLDAKGVLLYKIGLLKIEYPIDSKKEETWEASNLDILNGELQLGYARGYRVFADVETGAVLRGEFENRK